MVWFWAFLRLYNEDHQAIYSVRRNLQLPRCFFSCCLLTNLALLSSFALQGTPSARFQNHKLPNLSKNCDCKIYKCQGWKPLQLRLPKCERDDGPHDNILKEKGTRDADSIESVTRNLQVTNLQTKIYLLCITVVNFFDILTQNFSQRKCKVFWRMVFGKRQQFWQFFTYGVVLFVKQSLLELTSVSNNCKLVECL